MNCSYINDPAQLESLLRYGNERVQNQVFTCFFELYYKQHLAMTVNFCSKYPFTKHAENELAFNSFTDGLMRFYKIITTQGFIERGATVKTAFLECCKWKLRGAIRKIEREQMHRVMYAPEHVLHSVSASETINIEYSAEDQTMDKEYLFTLAFEQLPERDRRLIIYRKLENYSNETIALKMGIKAENVTNEVYRSMKRLKQLISDIKSGENKF